MEGKRIADRAFFEQGAVTLARDLLGKVLCHKVDIGGEKEFTIRCRITMTEAYPFDDEATDSYGKTEQTSQHLSGGHLYFKTNTAPNRWRFDITANKDGTGESVLIRGLDPYGSHPNLAFGAMDFDKELDGTDLLTSEEVWLEDDGASIEPGEDQPRDNIGKDISESSRTKKLKFTAKKITFK